MKGIYAQEYIRVGVENIYYMLIGYYTILDCLCLSYEGLNRAEATIISFRRPLPEFHNVALTV